MRTIRKVFFVIRILVTLALVAGIVWKLYDMKQQMLNDNIRFYREYSKVGENNIFEYVTDREAVNILKNGTGIVFFGFPSCKWCQEYVVVLNEVAKEYDVDKIYYLNIKDIRAQNTYEYKELVNMLENYLPVNEDGGKTIYVPEMVIVKNGEILGHNNNTSTLSGEDVNDYYTEEFRSSLKEELKLLINMLYPSTCNDDNIAC